MRLTADLSHFNPYLLFKSVLIHAHTEKHTTYTYQGEAKHLSLNFVNFLMLGTYHDHPEK